MKALWYIFVVVVTSLFARRKILEPKFLLSLSLFILILNTGCQTSQRNKNTQFSVPQNETQGIDTSNSDTQTRTEKPKYPYGVVNGIGQYVTESANSASDIAVGGTLAGIIWLEYEFWSSLCEVF